MDRIQVSRLRNALWASFTLLLIAIAVVTIALNTGSIRLSPSEVWNTLWGNGTNEQMLILFEYRLPRIIITALAGMGLGVAGAVLQGVSRNALADPGILGLHAGAAFGLIVFVSFFRTMEGPAALLIPLFTFAGGMVTAVIIFLFAYDRFKGLLPIRLILVGIAIEAGIGAFTLFLSLRLDEDTYSFTSRWLAGSVWGREWIHVWTLLPWIALLIPFLYSQSKKLDLFALGDELASGIGSRVTRNRIVMLAAAVALSCASVAMAGGIGFIGLVAPHIARRLAGPQHRYFLPVAALTGLVILVTADTIGRSILQPVAIPAGIVVAMVGGPYFLYMLFKTKF
ncbi:FecCD family ABC transporter permease [Paenibacillus radicis (ex Gao et al. 2016)]|uniref:Iron ABC transporter permease n=1 Tax=Paenibacillus radicis (ex Gao et al. 2016) TaxID=1737354 RepID=A0A917H2D5_9BACL|nr:iron ABC transporter permease [Paenibacillus radicis (ex Gao et al. 2016)]GGG65225.1 iron ABC transporter permease [Paenibacillus radicis (ex Gao et al. 2016)]